MASQPPVAANINVRGPRNAGAIALTLSATDPNPGEDIKSFSVTDLPADGILYLDAAETIAVEAGADYAATGGALTLYFAPATNFAGNTNFHYTATGGAGVAPNGTPPSTFYLTIDGLNGGSTAKGHKGAFEISSYNFDVSEIPSAVSGAPGVPKFDPLNVSLGLSSELTVLLADLATSQTIAHVRLEGVASLGGPDVFDLRLANVSVVDDSYTDGAPVSENIGFGYGAVSLTTTALTTTGVPGVSNTVGYDLRRNAPLTNPLAPAVAGPNSDGGVAVARAHYFLTVDGIGWGRRSQRPRWGF